MKILKLLSGKKTIARRISIIFFILLSALYITWRIGFTLNTDQMAASLIFLLVDTAMCFSAVWFAVSLWRPVRPAAPPGHGSRQFRIDVLVPTFNEDCVMLESTLRHCLAMDCPHSTYLLDDGNRPEVKRLAERLGVHYIAREKNTGAKAGNLNHALQYIEGELIAVFDADFRPKKEFLSRLSPYFHDDKTAVVQAPQSYYNTGSFQHRRLPGNTIYSDQDMFMHLILPARNNWNAAYWIGTNSLMRREAVESIGGFPTGCVTEDILTSMFIHGKGWKTVYVDEPLACGLAPDSISAYFIQRRRWAEGAFQILRSHHPLFQNGLSLMQRLFYFSSVSHFTEEIAKIAYYLFPACFFLFRTVPIHPYPPIVTGMVMYAGISLLTLQLITGGRTHFIMDGIYSVIRSFIYLTALPAFVFGKRVRFKVTPKSGGKPAGLQGAVGPAAIFGLNLAAIVAAVFNSFTAPLGVLGWIAAGWCMYTAGIAFSACLFCFKPFIKKSNEPHV